MTNHFAVGMTKATALTKAGKLVEATALIQALIRDPRAQTGAAPDEVAIEGSFTRLGDRDPHEGETDQASNTEVPRAQPRSSLQETVRMIRAGGMPRWTAFDTVPSLVPEDVDFILKTHGNGRDQRDYKLYIPASKAKSHLPLIVMLHGCTQSPDDFAAGTGMNALAEQHGFLVAYPAQPSGANANKCWNWFRPEDQERDRGEPALIAGIVRDIIRDHSVDPARVYVAGLSAGGAAAAIMATTYPEIFAAAGVHSGLPVGAASDIPQAFSAMRNGAAGSTVKYAVPTIVIHGAADATVNPSNGKAVVAQSVKAFGGLKATARKGVSAGGRSFRQTSYLGSEGRSMCEYWEIIGAGHAWAGGASEGSYTDPTGPSASEEMVRFFLQHRQR